jgi:hypothetical protein
VPSLYSIASDASKLSVAALPYRTDNNMSIPLGLSIKKSGWVSFKMRDLENMPDSLHIYLADAETGNKQDLRLTTPYRIYMKAGKFDSRFSIVFSTNELVNTTSKQSLFYAYNSQGKLYINMNIDKANLIVSNIMGQVIYQQSLNSKGLHEIKSPANGGIYVVSLVSRKNMESMKIYIGN